MSPQAAAASADSGGGRSQIVHGTISAVADPATAALQEGDGGRGDCVCTVIVQLTRTRRLMAADGDGYDSCADSFAAAATACGSIGVVFFVSRCLGDQIIL